MRHDSVHVGERESIINVSFHLFLDGGTGKVVLSPRPESFGIDVGLKEGEGSEDLLSLVDSSKEV